MDSHKGIPPRRRYIVRGGEVLHWVEHREGGLADGGPHSLCGLTIGAVLDAQRRIEVTDANRRRRGYAVPRICQNCLRTVRKEMLPALRASAARLAA